MNAIDTICAYVIYFFLEINCERNELSKKNVQQMHFFEITINLITVQNHNSYLIELFFL